MTTKPNDGGPAFPRATTLNPVNGAPWNDEQPGMSLRAWLASQEQLGEWEHPEAVISKEISEALAGCPTPIGGWAKDPIGMLGFEAKWRAALKVMRADALISELEKEAPCST